MCLKIAVSHKISAAHVGSKHESFISMSVDIPIPNELTADWAKKVMQQRALLQVACVKSAAAQTNVDPSDYIMSIVRDVQNRTSKLNKSDNESLVEFVKDIFKGSENEISVE